MRFRTFALGTTLLVSGLVYGQGTLEDYERAEHFLPENLAKLVFNLEVTPHWIGDSERFWFVDEGPRGHEFALVDPAEKKRRPAFDHVKLAESLAKVSGNEVDPNRLPFKSVRFERDSRIVFSWKEDWWTFDLESSECTKTTEPTSPAPQEVMSPDEKRVAFVRDYDLFLRDVSSGTEFRLTNDGERDHAWAVEPDTRLTAVTEMVQGRLPGATVIWSPDSKKIVTVRVDQRQVEELHLIQSVPKKPGRRPAVHAYRFPLPGDWDLPLVEYVIFDLEKNWKIRVDRPPRGAEFMSALAMQSIWWDEKGRNLYLLENERGFKVLRLWKIDAQDGSTRKLVEEESETYVEPHLLVGGRPNVRVLESSGEIIWFSQRDGWAHLYLYDGESGHLKNRVTTGPWVVRDIVHVDEGSRRVYFTAGGVDPNRDPYFRHLYRAHLDDGTMDLLTPEDADHTVKMTPSGSFFLDTFSTPDEPPVTLLRDTEGETLLTLAEANVEKLLEAGWRTPERFTVKARDGETDLYGVLYRPTKFDSSKSYPVLDSIYPGPQISRAPVSFAAAYSDPFGEAASFAELGFVVVTLDGLGTPLRSKAFHDVSYRNIGDAGGLEDHVQGLKQLAGRYSFLDIDRVGIYGHSGGGYASARAILQYPEFYKVAVSSAGNHDQASYITAWGERYHGLVSEVNYTNQANTSLADRLVGKLLLVHGELDDNVPPSLTMQLAHALMK
ncbi:MAG TPA: DPP IV N-terminal domain-containing protein, partial [Vicinamibacteria bacterium]|nr:DPP IV N-terminal domain-containing protein [Vicinamibacteria bacterium]